jgi:dTDP-4-dehydrorhamnose reductase
MILLGGTGQVGTALMRLVPDAVVIDRSRLDLAEVDEDRLRDLIHPHRDAGGVVNAAAYTAVDRAEAEEDLATRINGAAVGALAKVTAEVGMRFVSYSSDYVFDGAATSPYLEDHPTAPINAYGRSKVVGERLAMEYNPRTLVIRSSWVVSGTHPNFVATVLNRLADGAMSVVDDQWGCPTIADDLAAATLAALDAGVTGLLHRTNEGPTTWFRFARATAEAAGLDPDRISPTATGGYPTRAHRPAYSVLGSAVGPAHGLAALPPWAESLGDLVARLVAESP